MQIYKYFYLAFVDLSGAKYLIGRKIPNKNPRLKIANEFYKAKCRFKYYLVALITTSNSASGAQTVIRPLALLAI